MAERISDRHPRKQTRDLLLRFDHHQRLVSSGHGGGLKLVTGAVEDMRKAGKTIIPLCPFAAAQFKRHPEWSDLLRK